MRGDPQRLGELWHRQGPRDPSRVRLRALRHETQLAADALDCAGQDRGPTGRAIAVLGQLPGPLVVACARGTPHPNLLRHLVHARQVGEGSDRHGDLKRRGLATAPHHAGVHLIAPRPLEPHLVDETTQHGLALCLRQHVSGPEGRQVLANGAAGRLQRWWQRVGGWCAGLGALRLSGFGLLEGLQGQRPRVFQCGGTLPMRRIDVVALALTRGGLIAQPLEMLRVGSGEALGLLLPRGQCLGLDIEFHGREGLEKRLDDPGIDRLGRTRLTHGGPIRLSQVVTEGAGAALLLHDHLVAACAAGDESVQEGCARAREPTGCVPVILGVMVFAPGLHLGLRVPTDVGWGDIRDADAPLLLGQPGDGGACLRRLASPRAAAAIGERPRRGRMLDNGEHGRSTRSLPHQIAEAVTAGQPQVVGVEHLDDFPGRTTRSKRLEHQRQAGLGFLVGSLVHGALPVANQAGGQWQGQRATLGLLEESGGQAGFHGVPLPC